MPSSSDLGATKTASTKTKSNSTIIPCISGECPQYKHLVLCCIVVYARSPDTGRNSLQSRPDVIPAIMRSNENIKVAVEGIHRGLGRIHRVKKRL